MIKEAIGIGDTTDAALQDGCRQLGLEQYEVKFEVLEMPVKKTFGLFGGSPAKVRVYVENSPAEVAAGYLQGILVKMGVADATVEAKEVEGGAILTLKGTDIGYIIGRHGETLDALQYLTGLVANHVEDAYYRITLDTGNYREKREKTLESLARRMANKAIATNRKYALEPMNPYERRIIHTAVQDMEGATSWSEGDDFNRHVVIGPKDGVNARYGRDSRGRGERDRRGRGYGNDRRPARRSVSVEEQPAARNPKRDNEAAPLYGKIDIKKENQ